MSEEQQAQASTGEPTFEGSWILDRNENFDDFLSANGAFWPIRKMAAASTPTLNVTREGDTFTFILQSLVMTKETKIIVGQTTEEKQHSGDIMLCSPSWEGDKLVVEMKPKEENSKIKPQKHTRQIVGEELILTLEVDDIVAKRIFKRKN